VLSLLVRLNLFLLFSLLLTLHYLTGTEADFIRYMDPFAPFLFKALSNHEEHQTCSIAIGVMGDVCRALNEGVAPYCDNVMTILLQHLQNPMVHQLVKPACLSCFGDIALAIGGKFELYLPTVVGTLIQVYQGIAGEAVRPWSSLLL
jgi:importin subunit beta-1